jgi:hypothetical protein
MRRAAALRPRFRLAVAGACHQIEEPKSISAAEVHADLSRRPRVAQRVREIHGTLQKSHETRINFTRHGPYPFLSLSQEDLPTYFLEIT